MNEDVERQKELAIIELFWQRDDKAVQELDKMYGRFCYSISWQLLKNREECAPSLKEDTDIATPQLESRFCCL